MTYLDDRSKKLLTTIVDFPIITGKELEEKLGLSRKQLSYSMDKVNNYLIDNGFEKIKRQRTGKLIIPKSVIERFIDNKISYQEVEYIYSDVERRYLILLILLTNIGNLSSYDFTQKLKISKNTLSLDLRKLQDMLHSEYDLNILYNRKNGYTMVGGEYAKREVLIATIRKTLNIPNGKQILMNICNISNNDIIEMKGDISAIEHDLNIQFTDERLTELPYILHLIVRRIHANQLLDIIPAAYQHIVGTKEYSSTSHFIDKYGIEKQVERMFLSAQIQISNIHYLENDEYTIEKKLTRAASAIIHNFEEICCIKIKDKESLLEGLLQHCKPAFYRIKYQYHIESSILDLVLPQYGFLHEMVRRSVKPLENLLNQEIPDEELVYVTVLFGAWLKKEGSLDIVKEKKKALIVCTNGVSISNFLFITLQQTLPEINFLSCLSIRDFYEYEGDYDLVFSTVRLECSVPQFLVKPFIDENSRQEFRQMVLHEMEGINLYRIQVSSILSIIEKHTVVENHEALMEDLNQYLNIGTNKFHRKQIVRNKHIISGEYKLEELLTKKTVLIRNDTIEWREAIRLASIPLLQTGSIVESYVCKMIRSIETEKPYILITKGVIIAHAGINDGVQRVSMSLLKLDNKISINGYMEADIVIVLATPNKTSHLTALNTLIEITESKEKLRQIRKSVSVKEILNIINEK